MVAVKVCTWSVTGSTSGWIPLLAVLLKVNWESRSKESWLGAPPKAKVVILFPLTRLDFVEPHPLPQGRKGRGERLRFGVS